MTTNDPEYGRRLNRAKYRALEALKSKYRDEYVALYEAEMNREGFFRVPRGPGDTGGRGPTVWSRDLKRKVYVQYPEKYLDHIRMLGYPAETVIQFREELTRGDEARLEDYKGWLDIRFDRVIRKIREDELEFLRDEFCLVGENGDTEAYDIADEIQNEIEMRRYGQIVTPRTTDE